MFLIFFVFHAKKSLNFTLLDQHTPSTKHQHSITKFTKQTTKKTIKQYINHKFLIPHPKNNNERKHLKKIDNPRGVSAVNTRRSGYYCRVVPHENSPRASHLS